MIKPNQKNHWLIESDNKGYRSTCNSKKITCKEKIDWTSRRKRILIYSNRGIDKVELKSYSRWLQPQPLIEKKMRLGWVLKERNLGGFEEKLFWESECNVYVLLKKNDHEFLKEEKKGILHSSQLQKFLSSKIHSLSRMKGCVLLIFSYNNYLDLSDLPFPTP